MRKRLKLAAAAATIAASLSVAGGAAAEKTSLSINGWLPPFHPIMKMTVIPWSKEVEKATEGRVTFTITPQSVVPPPRQLDAVASGAVDIAYNVHGFTPGRFKAGQIGTLPFLADSGETLSVALWRTHEKHLAAADEYKGVRVLTLWSGTPGFIFSHTQPVRSMDDWKGLKVFCGVRSICDLIGNLGGTPVQRPGPEVTQIIERKIVDAAFIDPASYKNFRLDRFIRHATIAPNGFYAPTFYFIVNEKAWAGISEADRAAIDKLSGEALARKAGADWDQDTAESMALMEKNNVEVFRAEGDFLKAMEEAVVPEFTARYIREAKEAGIDGEEALAYLRAQIAAESN